VQAALHGLDTRPLQYSLAEQFRHWRFCTEVQVASCFCQGEQGGTHCVHWVALAALNQPSAQGRHTLFVVALHGTDWYVPATHGGVQALDTRPLQYSSAPQVTHWRFWVGVQVAVCLCEALHGATHCVHWVALAALNQPSAQSVHTLLVVWVHWVDS
jgi:hypothetical protein